MSIGSNSCRVAHVRWHLGHCNEAYRPTKRGFDTQFGIWLSHSDPYEKSYLHEFPHVYDFFEDDVRVTDPDVLQRYTGDLYQDDVHEHIHRQASQDKPMFLYLALQRAHSPLSVPQEYLDLYPHLEDGLRRNLSAVVSSMDAMLGNE